MLPMPQLTTVYVKADMPGSESNKGFKKNHSFLKFELFISTNKKKHQRVLWNANE